MIKTSPPTPYRKVVEDEAVRNGLQPDFRSELEVVNELSQVVKTYPSAYTHHVLEDRLNKPDLANNLVPLGFISNAQYVLGNETGQWSVFTSDRFGFQNDDFTYHRFPKKERPILLIGDSFVEGHSVGKDEDIAAKMREKNLFVLSYGMGGSGPIRNLATLKEYGLNLKPKVVFWFFTGLNDVTDLINEMKDQFLIKYLEFEFKQNLVYRQPEIDKFWETFINRKISERFHSSQDLRWSMTKLLADFYPFIDLYWIRKILSLTRKNLKFKKATPVFKDILWQANRLCDLWGASLIFVYLPSRESFNLGENRHNLKIKSIVRNMGIPMVDFSPIFVRSGQPSSFFPTHFYHYNAKGYSLIAHELSHYINLNAN